MFGKKRKFVVMDGSDKNFLQEIKGLSRMIMGRWRIKFRKLDRAHPTMKVATVKGNYADFDYFRKLLERDYPEQCIFDAPL